MSVILFSSNYGFGYSKIEEQNRKILHILSAMHKDSEKIVEETLYQPLIGFPLKTVDYY